MKKISITDSEKKLLFIVLALAILAASYFFGFTKLNDAAAEVEKSNEKDATTVATLEGMVAKQAETERETKGYKDGIKAVIAKYPSNIKQDKAIYLVQELQDAIELDVGAIGFNMNKTVQKFSGDNPTVGKYAEFAAFAHIIHMIKNEKRCISLSFLWFNDRTNAKSQSSKKLHTFLVYIKNIIPP